MSSIKPHKKALQKLISFTNNKVELDKITDEMNNGWGIISLTQNGNYYIGIMEKMEDNSTKDEKDITVYIPPRKKIKISY